MEMQAVSSSNITAIGYDEPERRLVVEFDSGGRYSYAGVPAEVYQSFMSAPSPGKFFYGHIKGRYSYQQA